MKRRDPSNDTLVEGGRLCVTAELISLGDRLNGGASEMVADRLRGFAVGRDKSKEKFLKALSPSGAMADADRGPARLNPNEELGSELPLPGERA